MDLNRDDRLANEFLDIFHNRDRLEELLKTYGNGELIPFVGAGLCMPKLPGWRQFLLAEAKKLGQETQVEELLNLARFEEAAEVILSCFGDPNVITSSEAFQERLRSNFGDDRYSPADLGEAIRLLPQLHRGFIATTNFDRALETIYKEADCPFADVYRGAHPLPIIHALTFRERVLWKIHGDVEDNRERVLTKADYDLYYSTKSLDGSPNLADVLSGLFSRKTVLFLGCSLGRDRTLSILEQPNRNLIHHFALVEDPGNREGRVERNSFLQARRIRPIFFPPGRYDYIAKVLKYLVAKSPPSHRPPLPRRPLPRKTVWHSVTLLLGLVVLFFAVWDPSREAVERTARILPQRVVGTIEGMPAQTRSLAERWDHSEEWTVTDRPIRRIVISKPSLATLRMQSVAYDFVFHLRLWLQENSSVVWIVRSGPSPNHAENIPGYRFELSGGQSELSITAYKQKSGKRLPLEPTSARFAGVGCCPPGGHFEIETLVQGRQFAVTIRPQSDSPEPPGDIPAMAQNFRSVFTDPMGEFRAGRVVLGTLNSGTTLLNDITVETLEPWPCFFGGHCFADTTKGP